VAVYLSRAALEALEAANRQALEPVAQAQHAVWTALRPLRPLIRALDASAARLASLREALAVAEASGAGVEAARPGARRPRVDRLILQQHLDLETAHRQRLLDTLPAAMGPVTAALPALQGAHAAFVATMHTRKAAQQAQAAAQVAGEGCPVSPIPLETNSSNSITQRAREGGLNFWFREVFRRKVQARLLGSFLRQPRVTSRLCRRRRAYRVRLANGTSSVSCRLCISCFVR
jgi:hypothetical protein